MAGKMPAGLSKLNMKERELPRQLTADAETIFTNGEELGIMLSRQYV